MMTDQHRRRGAQMIALMLAMKAVTGEPDAETLAVAIIAVGETFAVDDPLRIEVDHFAEMFPCARRQPELLTAAGQALWRAVTRSTWPMPCARPDIEG